MNSSFYRFILDMHSTQSQVSVPVAQYDTARGFYICFTDGGKPYFIDTGCLAMITITRPSGSKLHEYCVIEKNAALIYRFSENTAIEEGIHTCEVTLYGLDREQITSPRFSMIVDERVAGIDDSNGLPDEGVGILDELNKSEMERKSAEKERIKAEAERLEAEEARVIAEEDRAVAVDKIIAEQESIIAIQEALIEKGNIQEQLAEIITLQESYIGGDA